MNYGQFDVALSFHICYFIKKNKIETFVLCKHYFGVLLSFQDLISFKASLLALIKVRLGFLRFPELNIPFTSISINNKPM